MNATNPYFAHKYNSDGPAGFFLTFHTYGTRYLWNEKEILDACNYVINYQD